MAMFGMTSGALVVQLRPAFFVKDMLPMRLYQAALAMAASMPLALLIMLAIPVGISRALQSAVSFLLFSSVVAVPFFFSGVAVCIALTRMSLPRGRVYFVDLAGAGLGCLGAVGLLSIFDAPSAIFAISAPCFFAREPLPSTLNDPIYERTARSRRHRFWSWHVSTRQRCMEFSLFGRKAQLTLAATSSPKCGTQFPGCASTIRGLVNHSCGGLAFTCPRSRSMR